MKRRARTTFDSLTQPALCLLAYWWKGISDTLSHFCLVRKGFLQWATLLLIRSGWLKISFPFSLSTWLISFKPILRKPIQGLKGGNWKQQATTYSLYVQSTWTCGPHHGDHFSNWACQMNQHLNIASGYNQLDLSSILHSLK